MKINFETDAWVDSGKFIEKEITPEIKQVSEYEYVSTINIEGLVYSIFLSRKPGLILKTSDWYLDFSVNNTSSITNKGLEVFQKVVDGIENLIKTVNSIDSIQSVSFGASESRVSIEDIENLKDLLVEKYMNSPESFDGFECDICDGNSVVIGKLQVDKNEVVTTDFTKYQRNLQLRLPTSKRSSIMNFFENSKNIVMLLNREISGQKLIDYLAIEYKLPKNVSGRNVSKLRADLYERTLKQRFSKYSYERRGNYIKVDFKDK